MAASTVYEKYTYKAVSQALCSTSFANKDAIEAYQIFRSNPYHPSLHFKRIDPQDPIYSVGIGRRYRALGWYEGDVIRWYWIGA